MVYLLVFSSLRRTGNWLGSWMIRVNVAKKKFDLGSTNVSIPGLGEGPVSDAMRSRVEGPRTLCAVVLV